VALLHGYCTVENTVSLYSRDTYIVFFSIIRYKFKVLHISETVATRMSVRRKFADLLEYFNPFANANLAHALPSKDKAKDDDIPAAKRPRLEASTRIPTAEDAADTLPASLPRNNDSVAVAGSPSDAVAVAVAASLPSVGVYTGRARARLWKPEEDATLTDAVKGYGKDWVSVASLVPGRSNIQCSQRWSNLHPAIQGTKLRVGKWTPEEDQKLTDAVKGYGKDWVKVAALVPGRTDVQCCHRWLNCLGKWTVEADAKLIEAVKKLGNNWSRVAALVPGRTNDQCSERWVNFLGPAIVGTNSSNKGPDAVGYWPPEEDSKLMEAVTELGSNDWTAVAALVPGRMNEECRQRWFNRLAPIHRRTSHNRGPRTTEEDSKLNQTATELGTSDWVAIAPHWSPEEDSKLMEAVTELGSNDWTAVAALVPGRMNEECRQRWFDWLAPIHRRTSHNRGPWTTEEDAKLMKVTTELGTSDWDAIAALVPGRKNNQCRQRWSKSCNRGAWTREEEAMLTDAVKKYNGSTNNNWTAVAMMVPGRSNKQCRQRWLFGPREKG
jgi:hypothetical protein